MLADLLNQTADVFRATKTTDRHHNQVDHWPTTPTATYPARLQQLVGSEDSDGRDLSIGQWRLDLPGDVDITEHDRVRVAGRTFEVTAVYPVQSPRGTHHVMCAVTTYSGGVAS
jgi:head-tail adaptor